MPNVLGGSTPRRRLLKAVVLSAFSGLVSAIGLAPSRAQEDTSEKSPSATLEATEQPTSTTMPTVAPTVGPTQTRTPTVTLTTELITPPTIAPTAAASTERSTRPAAARETSLPHEPTVTPTITPTAAAWTAFVDDFEDGDLRRWDRNDGLFVQDQYVFDGRFAALASSSAAGRASARVQLSLPERELFIRIRFNIVDVGSNPVSLLRLRSSNGQPAISLYVNRNHTLGLRSDVTGESVKSRTLVVLAMWQELLVRAKVDVPGVTEVWLDGEQVIAHAWR